MPAVGASTSPSYGEKASYLETGEVVDGAGGQQQLRNRAAFLEQRQRSPERDRARRTAARRCAADAGVGN